MAEAAFKRLYRGGITEDMMDISGTIQVVPRVYWIGANDRETDKFEGLWELPHGVAYNAYFIDDDKTAVIDSVKASFMDDFLHRVDRLLGARPLDYVIVNHMEPDHSGSLALMRRLYPGVQFVGNAKTAEMIKNFYGITDGIVIVKEGDALDLGHHKLTFAMAPMVHWPESMITYDATDKILFSNDTFGGFGAVEGGLFDDEACMECAIDEMMRYFVNIVGRFSGPALKAIAKVRALDVSLICPAHGPIWRSNPGHVIDLYEKWSRQETEESAVVVFGSMYGNTKTASDAIARALCESGVREVVIYDISRSNPSRITKDIWKSRGLVLASCTYNMELYPPMKYLTDMLENKNMHGRKLGLCGTYSWASAALGEMRSFAERAKGGWEVIEPILEIKSHPTGADLEGCAALGRALAEAIRRT